MYIFRNRITRSTFDFPENINRWQTFCSTWKINVVIDADTEINVIFVSFKHVKESINIDRTITCSFIIHSISFDDRTLEFEDIFSPCQTYVSNY